MDKNGNPINAHPLTEREAKELIKALTINTQKKKSQDFLKPKEFYQPIFCKSIQVKMVQFYGSRNQ